MVNLQTTFAGLQLSSPLILSSSGLTRSIDRTKALVEAGAGAVILKSLFEEQILMHTGHLLAHNEYPEAADYIASYTRVEAVDEYLELLRRAKAELSVPIIASINCSGLESWTDFAQKLKEAGADALEVNIMRLETSRFYDPVAGEELYLEIVRRLRAVGLPLIIKLSRHHTALPTLVDKLRAAGATAITLFNPRGGLCRDPTLHRAHPWRRAWCRARCLDGHLRLAGADEDPPGGGRCSADVHGRLQARALHHQGLADGPRALDDGSWLPERGRVPRSPQLCLCR